MMPRFHSTIIFIVSMVLAVVLSIRLHLIDKSIKDTQIIHQDMPNITADDYIYMIDQNMVGQ